MTGFISRGATLIVLAGALFGCAAQHVTLKAPARTAPLAERLEAYRDLRLTEIETITGEHHSSTTWKLGDGTEVTRPEDLAQVVDPESETARRLHKYLRASDEHTTLGTTTLVTLLGSVALMATGLAIEEDNVAGVGAVGVLVSPFMYLVYLWQVSSTASEHLGKVPDLYNDDLRRHLDVVPTETFTDTAQGAPATPDDDEDFVDVEGAAP